MGSWEESISGRMRTVCTCIAAATRQASEADINGISKRRFRRMWASEEGTISFPQDEGTGVQKEVVRTSGGPRTFLDCLNDARIRVEQSKTDNFTRQYYRRLPE